MAWQAHWDHWAGVPTQPPATLTFKMHDQSEVWVRELNWVVSFAFEGRQPFPNFVRRLSDLPDEASQRAALPFAQRTAATVKVPVYTKLFRKVSAYKTDVHEQLLDAFKGEACSPDTMALHKNAAGRPVRNPHFWIAPLDIDFPVMLYFVEGVPYVGKVYFDTDSLKALYSEFNYIGDEGTGSRTADLKLMSGIKAEGERFELRGGRLVPVPR